MSKYLTAALIAFAAHVSPALAQETYDDYTDSEFVVLTGDCSNEGINKVLVFDNGAGRTWLMPNTASWCALKGRFAHEATAALSFRGMG